MSVTSPDVEEAPIIEQNQNTESEKTEQNKGDESSTNSTHNDTETKKETKKSEEGDQNDCLEGKDDDEVKETDAPAKVETNCAGDKKNGEAVAAEEDKTAASADINDTGKY